MKRLEIDKWKQRAYMYHEFMADNGLTLKHFEKWAKIHHPEYIHKIEK